VFDQLFGVLRFVAGNNVFAEHPAEHGFGQVHLGL